MSDNISRALVPISAMRIIRSREKVGRRRSPNIKKHNGVGTDLVVATGRPSYLEPQNEWLIEQMMVRVMNGDSLSEICAEDPRMPVRETVMKWLAKADRIIAAGEQERPKNQKYIQFLHRYNAARARQPDALLDDCLPIADDARNDWMERQNKKGETYLAFDHEHVQRSRLRIDLRMKLAEKLAPKKYGVRPEVHASTTVNDNRKTQNNFAAIVVQRAEEKTRGLPSETLLKGGKLEEDD